MKSKINVGIDLFLKLNMYNVPSKSLIFLKKKYPNINFIPVNLGKKNYPYNKIDIYWGNRITPNIIKQSENLKWIHFGSVGVERSYCEETIKKKIIVTNSKHSMTDAMVTTGLAFITFLSRNFHIFSKIRNNKNFNRKTYDKFFNQTLDLNGKSCFIAGMGSVGKKLSIVLKTLGMNIIGKKKIKFDKNKNHQFLKFIEKADFIVNLLPLTKKTKKIFDKKAISKIGKKSFFINIGRGETVDEKYLIHALKNKKISGAALDVFAKEPLSSNSKLFKLSNVLITPHVAGVSKNYWEKQIQLFDYNLSCFLKKKYKSMKNRIIKFN